MKVKYLGLISEVLGNIDLSSSSPNVSIALAISTLVFGLLEGGISYWKSRKERSGDEESQIESKGSWQSNSQFRTNLSSCVTSISLYFSATIENAGHSKLNNIH